MWTLLDIFAPGETARAEELERRNQELNARRVAMGRDTSEAAQAQEAAFNHDGPGSFNAQIADAAAVGAMEGLQSLPGKVRGALTGTAGWTLAFIPWWGWALGAVALFVWLGGVPLTRGILVKGGK